MSIRNEILAEMQARLNRAGIRSVRNPSSPPASSDYPIVMLVTGPSSLYSEQDTGDFLYPVHNWVVTMIPYYVSADLTDETCEAEIEDWILTVILAIFGRSTPEDVGDNSLGGRCDLISIVNIGDLIKPWAGEPGIGIQIDLRITHSLFEGN